MRCQTGAACTHLFVFLFVFAVNSCLIVFQSMFLAMWGFFPTKDTLKVLIFTVQKVLAEMGSFTSEIPVFINLFSFTVDHQEI